MYDDVAGHIINYHSVGRSVGQSAGRPVNAYCVHTLHIRTVIHREHNLGSWQNHGACETCFKFTSRTSPFHHLHTYVHSSLLGFFRNADRRGVNMVWWKSSLGTQVSKFWQTFSKGESEGEVKILRKHNLPTGGDDLSCPLTFKTSDLVCTYLRTYCMYVSLVKVLKYTGIAVPHFVCSVVSHCGWR